MKNVALNNNCNFLTSVYDASHSKFLPSIFRQLLFLLAYGFNENKVHLGRPSNDSVICSLQRNAAYLEIKHFVVFIHILII